MKKMRKSLILLSLALIAISLFLQTNINVENKKIGQEIQAYNYNPANILDNVFVEGGTRYLPFIFTNPNQEINVNTLKLEFKKAGLTVKNISTNNIIATGTTITVNENSNVYTVIIYGDTNGDGKVNLIDAQKVVLYKKFPTTYKLEGVFFKAANTSNQDNLVNLIDAQRIVLFKKGTLTKLLVEDPKSDRELDTIKPVITLKGSQTVTIKVNTTYTDAGATATDNYDGDITSKIKVTNNVNTKVAGNYTVTYNVTDSNGNVANTVTRIVKVIDAIKLIEMEKMPTTTYNYGASKLDLTGATIKVTWLSGKTEIKTITENMLSNYDLSKAGTKTITVNYEGFQTKFNATVLNKITSIELLEAGRQNVNIIDGKYKVTTTQEFILGTIKEKQQTSGSKLEVEQVNVEVEIVSSEDSSATVNDLRISAINNNGKILLKGKALKPGNYTIDVFIKYGEEKIQIPQINLNAEKSNVIKEISLETIFDEEVKDGVTKIAIKEITAINENGETIDIMAKQLKISNVTNGIIITKLDANKDPIVDDTIVVKYLDIETTLTTKQEVKFTMKVNDVEKTISFIVGDKLVLSNITLGAQNIQLYVEKVSNVVEQEGKYYTILPINFYSKSGEKMNVQASDIITSTNSTDFENIEEGKVGIVLPKAIRKITIGSTIIEKEGNALDVKFYDENGLEATGTTNVAKIGIAITIDNPSIKIDLSSLEGKKIQFVYANQINTCELAVKINNI